MFEKLKKRINRYNTINKVTRELHGMTNRDLADIGISRYDIERIVKETHANY